MANPTSIGDAGLGLLALLGELRELIRQARQRALRAVDTIQVQTCWDLGRHIVEFEQAGAARAAYGKRLMPELSTALTAEFSTSGIYATCAVSTKHFQIGTRCVPN